MAEEGEVEVRFEDKIIHVKGRFTNDNLVSRIVDHLIETNKIPRVKYKFVANDKILPEIATLELLERPLENKWRLFLFKK